VAKGVTHYLKNGTLHKGGTHKHPDGKVMTGKRMTKQSKNLYHYGSLSKAAKQKARQSWKS
jgi:hypothetical protein